MIEERKKEIRKQLAEEKLAESSEQLTDNKTW